MESPSPYEPLFYFPGKDGKRLVEFVKERRLNEKKLVKLEGIQISIWALQIVNLWGNGSYGVLLKVYAYKKLPINQS